MDYKKITPVLHIYTCYCTLFLTEIPAEHIDPGSIDLTSLMNTLLNASHAGNNTITLYPPPLFVTLHAVTFHKTFEVHYMAKGMCMPTCVH